MDDKKAAKKFVTMYGDASKQSAKEAFADAQEIARFHHGLNGYTGTIAEVSDYKEFPADIDIDHIIATPSRSGVDRDTCGYYIDPDNGAYVFFGLARHG